MNKLASINFIMEKGIPTLDIHIIDKGSIESDISRVFSELDQKEEKEWVVRCGEKPNINGTLEKGMPWTRHIYSCSSAIKTVKDYYSRLTNEHLVFIHLQREFDKSGNLIFDDRFDRIVVEMVRGWPEPLSHGRVYPEAIYYFESPWFLRSRPYLIEGDKKLLLPEDWYNLDRNVCNKLDLREFSKFHPITVEFSFNKMGNLDVHDIDGRIIKNNGYFKLSYIPIY